VVGVGAVVSVGVGAVVVAAVGALDGGDADGTTTGAGVDSPWAHAMRARGASEVAARAMIWSGRFMMTLMRSGEWG